MALYQLRLNNILKYTNVFYNYRYCSTNQGKKGLILGVYSEKKTNEISLTSGAKYYNEITGGKLLESIKFAADNKIKQEQAFVFWGLCEKYRSVAVVGIGGPSLGYDELEEIDEKREAIRVAAHVGCKTLKSVGMSEVDLDGMGQTDAVAEGASLSTWSFDTYRKDKKPHMKINLFKGDSEQWKRGLIKGTSQNLSRLLMDTPANLKAPTVFAEKAKKILENQGVKVEIHNKTWIKDKKMGGLISVSNGSSESPVFLEMNYNGAGDEQPIVLIGKGVTFDAGGYALKPSKNMDLMRGDCGGACCVVATLKAIAQLKLPINVIGLIPLTENLINGIATKPGDVITMMNGKTVAVDNPDAEGRLVLGDALSYSASFNPKFVLDMATLTGAMHVALGSGATGVFTNSTPFWDILQKAGVRSGDRMWRFPLWKHYSKLVTDYTGYDVNNIGKGNGGGACTAAAFLKEFVPENTPWAHLDIAGVTGCGGPTGDKIVAQGMNGKPTRTIIYFLEALSNK